MFEYDEIVQAETIAVVQKLKCDVSSDDFRSVMGAVMDQLERSPKGLHGLDRTHKNLLEMGFSFHGGKLKFEKNKAKFFGRLFELNGFNERNIDVINEKLCEVDGSTKTTLKKVLNHFSSLEILDQAMNVRALVARELPADLAKKESFVRKNREHQLSGIFAAPVAVTSTPTM